MNKYPKGDSELKNDLEIAEYPLKQIPLNYILNLVDNNEGANDKLFPTYISQLIHIEPIKLNNNILGFTAILLNHHEKKLSLVNPKKVPLHLKFTEDGLIKKVNGINYFDIYVYLDYTSASNNSIYDSCQITWPDNTRLIDQSKLDIHIDDRNKEKFQTIATQDRICRVFVKEGD